MQKRKAAIHQKQKSQDVSSRRSAAKPAKTREEQALNESPAPLAFHVDIPKGLKDILVKSRIQIKQKEKVLVLPRDWAESHKPLIPEKPISVKETLDKFMEYFLDKANEKSLKQAVEDSSIIPVITRGLIVYFEKTIATNILYFEERGQYAFLDNKYRSGAAVTTDMVEEQQPLCMWYGPDHLLRLLVILPEILSKSSLDGYSTDLIGIYVQNLLSWLDDNKDSLFVAPLQYIEPPFYYKTDVRRRNHGGTKEILK